MPAKASAVWRQWLLSQVQSVGDLPHLLQPENSDGELGTSLSTGVIFVNGMAAAQRLKQAEQSVESPALDLITPGWSSRSRLPGDQGEAAERTSGLMTQSSAAPPARNYAHGKRSRRTRGACTHHQSAVPCFVSTAVTRPPRPNGLSRTSPSMHYESSSTPTPACSSRHCARAGGVGNSHLPNGK